MWCSTEGIRRKTHLCRLLWKSSPPHQEWPTSYLQLFCLQRKPTCPIYKGKLPNRSMLYAFLLKTFTVLPCRSKLRGILLRVTPSLLKCFGYLLEIFQIRDNTQEPCGRLSFMKEPRSYRSLAHNAICNLNITLPTYAKVIYHIYNEWSWW